MDIEKCEGLLEPGKKLYAMILRGNYPNKDIWLGESLRPVDADKESIRKEVESNRAKAEENKRVLDRWVAAMPKGTLTSWESAQSAYPMQEFDSDINIYINNLISILLVI